jgi:hypothetical protein
MALVTASLLQDSPMPSKDSVASTKSFPFGHLAHAGVKCIAFKARLLAGRLATSATQTCMQSPTKPRDLGTFMAKRLIL